MRHPVDARLRDEARAFALRFGCEDCAHFAPARAACVHGYTERPSVRDLEPGRPPLAFCKEFELGDASGALAEPCETVSTGNATQALPPEPDP